MGTVVCCINMDLREMSCEDGRWFKPDQDLVLWQCLVSVVLNLWVVLAESHLACA